MWKLSRGVPVVLLSASPCSRPSFLLSSVQRSTSAPYTTQMASNEPPQNATATADLIVGPHDLASALPLVSTDAFPAVLATARMVALMEIASARVLQPYLSVGQLSVGVRIDVTHSAPTPLGAAVTAMARYLGRDGRLFDFEIVATDNGGEIGRAQHKRAIVDVERIQGGATRRVAIA